MIDIQSVHIYGWQEAIHGMRNSWNSWEKSDSVFDDEGNVTLGFNDYGLMYKLTTAHPSHAKFRRMITVYCNITAPLYWWKEFDTYKVGTVSNSMSTMHTIMKKEFEPDDFSHEHLLKINNNALAAIRVSGEKCYYSPDGFLKMTCEMLNTFRSLYLTEKDPELKKEYWWQIIQLLPSSFNQTRTVLLNYEVLSNIYENRKDHRLDEWKKFCNWIWNLPYPLLITGEQQVGCRAG